MLYQIGLKYTFNSYIQSTNHINNSVTKIIRLVKITVNRHFSHVTKSRVFKNLNSRKKADHNFCDTFLKNRFRHLKLYSNPPRWLARSRCYMAPFERQKIEVNFFERTNFPDFGTWKFTAKEDLNWRKLVFLEKNKNLVYNLSEKVYIRKFCSVKAGVFWFKNWYCPSSACCS